MKRTLFNRFSAALTPIAAAMIAAPMFSSCVAEDMSDCPPEVRLLVKTDHEMNRYGQARRVTETELMDWYSSIENVTVYVFDEDERFVTLWEGGPHTGGVDYEVPLKELNLPDGTYTFVAWTNLGLDCYTSNADNLRPGDDLDRFMVETTAIEGGRMVGDFEHRHYGILRTDISGNSILEPGDNIIEIAPNVHKVNFTFNVLPNTDDAWELTAIARNPAHDFHDLPIAGRGEYRQTRALTESNTPGGEGVSMQTSMMLMQLQDTTGTTVELVNKTTGDVVYSENLVEWIQRVYSVVGGQTVDFRRTLEFDVAINLNIRQGPGTAVMVSITVNGWTYVLNEKPLG